MNDALLNFGAATICWDQTILINGGGVSGNRTLFGAYNLLIYLLIFLSFFLGVVVDHMGGAVLLGQSHDHRREHLGWIRRDLERA